MSTLVIFGDAADGYVTSSNVTYATAASSGTLAATDNTQIVVGQALLSGYAVEEGFVGFDTSVIGASAVAAASLSLSISTTQFPSSATTCEVRADDWGTTVTTADWVADASLSGLTLVGNSCTNANAIASDYNVVASGAALVSSLTSGGFSRYLLNTDNQRTGTPPTGGGDQRFFFLSADNAGTTTDPKLAVAIGTAIRSLGVVGSAVSGNLDLTYPTSVATGDRFAAVITAQDNIASTITGWTLDTGSSGNNGTGLRDETWYKDTASDGTETGTLTWTRTSGLASEGRILAIVGAVATGNPIEASARSANSASSTVTWPALTTLTNAALVIAVESIATVATLGAISGTDPTLVEEADDSFDPRPSYLGATPVNSSAAGTGFTLPIPTTLGIVVGDLVVLAVETKSATTTAVTRSSGGGATNPWSSLRAKQLNLVASATASSLYYGHIVEAADIGASVVFTYDGGSVKSAVVASYWHNAAVLASQPNASAAQANASAATATLPTVTPTVANTVELAIAGSGATVNIASIAGFTVPAGAAATGSGGAGSTQCGIAIAYKLYPASGGATGTSTVNLSGTSSGCATAHIVIAPANATSNPVSQAIADDNKTTAGLIASGRTATATVAAVNTGVLFAIKPSASSTTYSHTMTGGATTGGTSALTRKAVIVASGGATAGGVAAKTAKATIVASGGGTTGGTATVAYRTNRVVTPSGGLTSSGIGTIVVHSAIRVTGGATTSGSATVRTTVALATSGGATTGGSAAKTAKAVLTASGGATFGGTASVAVSRQYQHVATGGATFGGDATTSFSGVSHFTYDMTGGAATGGSALVARRVPIATSGGLTSAGTALIALRATVMATGGATTSGAATTHRSVQRALTMSGGLTSSGVAPIQAARALVMSGGVTSAGAGTIHSRPHITASGGLTTSGASALRRSVSVMSTGGGTTGGHATLARAIVLATSGGALFGGEADTSNFAGFNVFRPSVSGGALFSGTAAIRDRPALVMVGGATCSGAAATHRRLTGFVSGGLTTSGIATLQRSITPSVVGGLFSGGRAPAQRRIQLATSGGLTSGGSALGTFSFTGFVSGGIVTSGTAALQRTVHMLMHGGVFSGGTAIVTRSAINGPTITFRRQVSQGRLGSRSFNH